MNEIIPGKALFSGGDMTPPADMPEGYGLLMAMLSRMSGAQAVETMSDLMDNGAWTPDQARWVLEHVHPVECHCATMVMT